MPGIGLMRRDENAMPSPISESSRDDYVPWSEPRAKPKPTSIPPSPDHDGFKIQFDCSSGRRILFEEDQMMYAQKSLELKDKFEKIFDVVHNGPFVFSEQTKREIGQAVCTTQRDFHEAVENISAAVAKMKDVCKCIECKVR